MNNKSESKRRLWRIPSNIFPPGAFEIIIGFTFKTATRISVRKSEDVHQLLKEIVIPHDQFAYAEYFYIFLLDRSNKIYAYQLLSKGGMAGTIVDLRLLFQTVLLCHSSSIILAHNHPSGNLKPSASDIEITKRIVE